MVARENERHGAGVLRLVLDSRPQMAIENSTVMMSAKNNHSTEMLGYFLDTPGLVSLTETLLVSMVRECPILGRNDGLVGKILDIGNDLGYSSRCMLKSVLRESYFEQNVQLVTDRYKPPL